MSTVAPEVSDQDVCSVGFRRETIVADVDASVRYSEAIDIEGVEAIGVLWERGDICGYGVDVDVIEDNVLGAYHEGRPARGVFEV